ncbi:MAG: hypothetical protein RL522_55 [Pseudomonadota bacterium]|jgi:hypothetical protein
MAGTYIALAFTVLLLVTKAYFLVGGLPLLVLQHDTPLDGHFVRRFFEVYYTAAVVAATGATAGYALWGKPLFAAGTAAIAFTAILLRRVITPAMQRLGQEIQTREAPAIAAFRKVHATALLLNLLQLVALVWGVIQISA